MISKFVTKKFFGTKCEREILFLCEQLKSAIIIYRQEITSQATLIQTKVVKCFFLSFMYS